MIGGLLSRFASCLVTAGRSSDIPEKEDRRVLSSDSVIEDMSHFSPPDESFNQIYIRKYRNYSPENTPFYKYHPTEEEIRFNTIAEEKRKAEKEEQKRRKAEERETRKSSTKSSKKPSSKSSRKSSKNTSNQRTEPDDLEPEIHEVDLEYIELEPMAQSESVEDDNVLDSILRDFDTESENEDENPVLDSIMRDFGIDSDDMDDLFDEV